MKFLFRGKTSDGAWIESNSIWQGRGVDLLFGNIWIPVLPITLT